MKDRCDVGIQDDRYCPLSETVREAIRTRLGI